MERCTVNESNKLSRLLKFRFVKDFLVFNNRLCTVKHQKALMQYSLCTKSKLVHTLPIHAHFMKIGYLATYYMLPCLLYQKMQFNRKLKYFSISFFYIQEQMSTVKKYNQSQKKEDTTWKRLSESPPSDLFADYFVPKQVTGKDHPQAKQTVKDIDKELHDLFLLLNRNYFNNRLDSVQVKWSSNIAPKYIISSMIVYLFNNACM